MGDVTSARRVAHHLLGTCRRRDARIRDVARSSGAMAALSARDRAFAQRLALGVTGAVGLLDGMIDSHVRRGIRLEPRIRDALRMAAFELCFMRTPPAVAVDQGVCLVRTMRPRAAGLANAVLRAISRLDAPRRAEAVARVSSPVGRDGVAAVSVDDLALVSGYPAWLIGRVALERGMAVAASLARAAVVPPPVYVAPNLAKAPAEEVVARLVACGAAPTPERVANAYRLAGTAPPAVMAALVHNVDLVVADLSSQRVAAACAPRPGARVLEVGQGRATKTVLLENAAMAGGGAAEVVGMDVVPSKVGLAARRMVAAGLSDHVRCVAYDARRLSGVEVPPEVAGPYDLVLVDAPCSGSGTLRRHPEIAWSLSPDVLAGEGELPSLQLAILSASSARVAPGGLLAYATCSMLRAEDEDVIGRFLASPAGSSFKLVDSLLTETSPAGPDAHFLARLRRIADRVPVQAPSDGAASMA